jgi:GNAT superfamily N-acetyltransferase
MPPRHSPAELIHLSDLSYAEALRELTRRAGGAVHDEDGLMLFAGPHPLPVLANGVMRAEPRLSAPEALARARDFFAPRRRGYSVLVRAHADGDLHEAAAAAGLRLFGEPPGMVLDHRLPDAAPPPGVTLARVETAEDVAAFADVQARAWATYGMPLDVAPASLGRLEVVAAPHVVSVLARAEGVPVAGAMTIVTHGVAGVYWVGTVPEARGRGLAALCTRAAGNAGFDLGARVAALQASPMGEPVYRRMGYVEVTRYPYFVAFAAAQGKERPPG